MARSFASAQLIPRKCSPWSTLFAQRVWSSADCRPCVPRWKTCSLKLSLTPNPANFPPPARAGINHYRWGTIVTQTIALFLDAYRELNSKKLFWITLILSGLVIIAFAFLGVSGSKLVYASMSIDVAPADPITLYKLIFSFAAVGIWLSWGAVGLGIISTAGMLPDLISSGTIDVYLSKPISRLRLFLTKYVSGLLFVTLQVAVFSLGSFVIFGIRGHQWRPSLFLAIPLVVALFSYVFGFCVLIGVWTRSTVTAILLTVLFWLLCWGVQKSDVALLAQKIHYERQSAFDKQNIFLCDTVLASLPADHPRRSEFAAKREQSNERLVDTERSIRLFEKLHLAASVFETIVPKTTETNNILDRKLFSDEEAARQDRTEDYSDLASPRPFGVDEKASAKAQMIKKETSPWYIIGTSLITEAVLVGFAAWIFCRRDY